MFHPRTCSCNSPYLLLSAPCSAVEVVCREGPARVLELVKLGADFTRNNDGTLHLTREGGHTNRRIVHAADLTGKQSSSSTMLRQLDLIQQ